MVGTDCKQTAKTLLLHMGVTQGENCSLNITNALDDRAANTIGAVVVLRAGASHP